CALLAAGIKKGDRVGIWAPNRYEWPVVQYATARIGAILVNINPAYRAFELEYVLRQSGVISLFLARAFRQAEYEPMLAEVRPNCPDLRHIVVLDREWDQFLESGGGISSAALTERETRLQFDDPINIQ